MADQLITGTTLIEDTRGERTNPPVGSVVAWLKSFTGTPKDLPYGWVECNGQTLSDADSVYDGQTLPDLNGDNRFLRGNSTSGGTGGAATNTANLAGTVVSITLDGDLVGFSGNDLITSSTGGSGTKAHKFTEPFDILPPYYNVVWIMRVKS